MQSERRQIENRIIRLYELFPAVEGDEVRAELTKHLCVLTSGMIEVTCRDILTKYSEVRCSPQVLRHVSTSVAGFQNANTAKIIELFSSFDPEAVEKWCNDLLEEESASINSIISNRHQIAHGRSIGLSFDVLQRYYKFALSAVQKLENCFPGHKKS